MKTKFLTVGFVVLCLVQLTTKTVFASGVDLSKLDCKVYLDIPDQNTTPNTPQTELLMKYDPQNWQMGSKYKGFNVQVWPDTFSDGLVFSIIDEQSSSGWIAVGSSGVVMPPIDVHYNAFRKGQRSAVMVQLKCDVK